MDYKTAISDLKFETVNLYLYSRKGCVFMKRFVPIEKMSKKKRAEYYKKQRKDWGGLSPETRRPPEKKLYSRAKEKAMSAAQRSDY